MDSTSTLAPDHVDTNFQLAILRSDLLPALQAIASIVDKKQTLPILSHLLLRINDQKLTIIATDLEIELIKVIPLSSKQPNGEMTVPARKLFDICKALPEDAVLHCVRKQHQLLITSGKSRFTLTLLPASRFPCVEKTGQDLFTLTTDSGAFKDLLERTSFAMAIQDVRYFLNGLLLDITGAECTAVATDGHRLAMSRMSLPASFDSRKQVLLPRKSVLELVKLLNTQSDNTDITLTVGENYISILGPNFEFISKLIDSRFPDYRGLIPNSEGSIITVDMVALKETVLRVAILSNEKYRGAWLDFSEDRVILQTNNPDKDEAEEELPVTLQGDAVRIGCNISYLLDILAVLSGEMVQFATLNANASILVQDPAALDHVYVVMPMCL